MSPNVAIRDIVGGVTAPKGFRAAGVSGAVASSGGDSVTGSGGVFPVCAGNGAPAVIHPWINAFSSGESGALAESAGGISSSSTER